MTSKTERNARAAAENRERLNKDNQAPFEMKETVTLKRPFKMRIHKSTLKVTLVEPRGPAMGYVNVGDEVIAIDKKPTKDIESLNQALRKPTPKADVTLKRNYYSRCKHKCTTVETLVVEKGRGIKVMRAVELYSVQLYIGLSPDVDLNQMLGLSVKYDAKERVQVAKVDPAGVASVHLRPGDIIREINGHPIASKSLLIFWMLYSLSNNRQVRFLIESAAGDESHIEMPEDVLGIVQKQIPIERRSKAITVPKGILRKGRSDGKRKNIQIAAAAVVEQKIGSDYDESTLKHVRKEAL